jgi:hypothetical protein
MGSSTKIVKRQQLLITSMRGLSGSIKNRAGGSTGMEGGLRHSQIQTQQKGRENTPLLNL